MADVTAQKVAGMIATTLENDRESFYEDIRFTPSVQFNRAFLGLKVDGKEFFIEVTEV